METCCTDQANTAMTTQDKVGEVRPEIKSKTG